MQMKVETETRLGPEVQNDVKRDERKKKRERLRNLMFL